MLLASLIARKSHREGATVALYVHKNRLGKEAIRCFLPAAESADLTTSPLAAVLCAATDLCVTKQSQILETSNVISSTKNKGTFPFTEVEKRPTELLMSDQEASIPLCLQMEPRR